MNKNSENIDELIVRQLTESLNASDLQTLEAWIEDSEDNKTYYNQVREIWGNSENFMAFDAVNVDEDYELFAKKVGFINERQLSAKSFISLKNIAAILLPFLAISLVFTLYQTTPGFGKWVAYESSNTIEKITLPDHSIVDLNANSELVYKRNFKGAERSLSLEGEGYFKVTKNPNKPFVVNVGETKVRVLGTAFYLEEDKSNGEVTLIVTEGKVLFSTDNQQLELIKNESAVYRNGVIVKSEKLPSNNMSWRTGLIEFDKANLTEVMETLLDHFTEIESIDNKTQVVDRVITTKFNSPSLEEVLVELRIHFDKNFTLDGNKLVISD